jgi:hypothetical protein
MGSATTFFRDFVIFYNNCKFVKKINDAVSKFILQKYNVALGVAAEGLCIDDTFLKSGLAEILIYTDRIYYNIIY